MKSLAIVLILSALLYIGVEPLAHHVMHPSVAPADYSFKDVGTISSKGDIEKGKAAVEANCIACHALSSQGFAAVMSNQDAGAAYGVVVPDLSTAGVLYERNYLAAFIKNPAKAAKLSHKFNDENPHPMPSFEGLGDEVIADMVAYLTFIAPKEISGKAIFADACERCHSMKYDTLQAFTSAEDLKRYMGAKIPDLSMIIRSKDVQYLHTFINDPQKLLAGTSMPRVGLTQASETKLISYFEKIGDSKKEEREHLGLMAILFMSVMSVVAYLWKVKIWREVE